VEKTFQPDTPVCERHRPASQQTLWQLKHCSEPAGRFVACTAASPRLDDTCEWLTYTSPTQAVLSRRI